MNLKKSTIAYLVVLAFLAFNVLLYYFIQTFFS
jgi:hypothetical protein